MDAKTLDFDNVRADLLQLHPFTCFSQAHFKAAVIAFTCAGELRDDVPVPDLLPMLLHHAQTNKPCQMCFPFGTKVTTDLDGCGWTPLHEATFKGHEPCAIALVRLGARVNQSVDRGGSNAKATPLKYAARCNSVPMVKALIKAGAEVDAKDTEGSTPLMQAASSDQGVDVARLLLEAGANIHARNKYGYAAVSYAVNFGCEKMGKFLREHGAQ